MKLDPNGDEFLFFFCLLNFYLLIFFFFREREEGRTIDLLLHLFMHSLVVSFSLILDFIYF